MDLISEEYRQQNAELHRSGRYGRWGYREAENILKTAKEFKCESILDFGAGQGTLSKTISLPVTNYDPAIEEYSELPTSKFDLVVCFPSGTHVRGSNKTIESIQVGDVVSDKNNGEQRVTKKYEREYSGKMHKIKVANLPEFHVTPEHPVLVSDVRRVHRKNNTSHKKSEYEYVNKGDFWKSAELLEKGDWVSLPRETEIDNFYFSFEMGRGKKISTNVLDEDLAWLLGLYAGDGCSHFPSPGAGVGMIYLGYHEEDIAERAKYCLQKIGVNSSIDERPDRGVRVVRFSCVGLCKRLCEWISVHAKNKEVPIQVLKSEESVVRGFIEGLVDSDGCIRDTRGDKYYSVSTISTNLAYGLVELLHKIGVGCRLHWEDPSEYNIQGRTGMNSGHYTISWQYRNYHSMHQSGMQPYSACRFIEDRVYLRVSSIEEYSVDSEVVYNIETEDNTYNIPITVHNCSDVLEHVEPEYLDNVLETIRSLTEKVAYFVIATSLDGTKTLPDGRDPHLIVEDGEWWVDRIYEHLPVYRYYKQDRREAVVIIALNK